MTVQNKKSSIILVLKVLEEYSDEDHYLTYQEIIEKVNADYGIELERKSVAYSIQLLIDLEYDINPNPSGKGGWALYDRQFSPSEARFLIDAAFSSRVIPAKTARTLSMKIQQGFSRYARREYGYIAKSVELSRSDNYDILLSIEIISEAIAKGKCVSFQLRGYNEDGEPCLRKDGKRYIASPYYIVNNLSRYYLFGCPDYGEPRMTDYRVDYMVAARIESEANFIDSKSVLGEDFSIAKYLDEHIHLLHGEIIDALIRIEDHIEGRKGSRVGEGVRFLRDWFGNKAKVIKNQDDGKVYAKVRCDASSLFYWIMQYSEEFTLIEPKERVDEIKAYLKTYLDKYGGSTK